MAVCARGHLACALALTFKMRSLFRSINRRRRKGSQDSPHILKPLLACALLGCAASQVAAQPAFSNDDVVVEAPAGPLHGEISGGVVSFKGIPYALPPIGERRWTPPQSHPDWVEMRAAKEFGAACPQMKSRTGSIYATPLPKIDEDCLFLNVWAPPNAQNAPVFVWIHGGSLVSGAGSLPMYDGAKLAREQGMIVVSINYRLGVLGYFAHPELSAESAENISGNYGLQDQILAMKWVRRNIAAFGGNPENVTVAGESAGALSVMLLMTSPKAQGLFDKAIAQSAYMVSMAPLRGHRNGHGSAEDAGLSYAKKMGEDTISALRDIPADDLIERSAQTGFVSFGVIDDAYLTDQMPAIFDKGQQADVPILAGYNEGEIRSLRFLLPPAAKDEEAYESAIRAGYGELADDVLKLYPSDTIKASMLAMTRDAMYGWTAERLVRSQTIKGHASYLYLFDHSYPAADRYDLRAFHAMEIPYVFGTIYDVDPPWPQVPRNREERQLSDEMMQYWASFARDGVAVAKGGSEWPAYGRRANGMVFASKSKAYPFMASERFTLHEKVVCRRRAAGDMQWNWNVGIISPPLPEDSTICH